MVAGYVVGVAELRAFLAFALRDLGRQDKVTDVDAGGGVDVGLQPGREVVEDAIERDLPGAGFACAWDVLYPLVNGVPRAVVFIGLGVLWRSDGFVADD